VSEQREVFKGIEGARAWLAWTVVAAHVVVASPLVYFPAFMPLIAAAEWAVKVFIIISGFVITHLLMRTRESYALYICRRALRIYPAYLIALVLGVAAAPLFMEMLAAFPMQPPHEFHLGVARSRAVPDPTLQLLLHLTLLQGMFPATQHGYLPPGWSLSLEWQFYLLAPLFVAAARKWPAATSATVGLLWLAFALGVFGRFANPSLILGAGWYFLAGIFSRLYLERLPSFANYPFAGLLLLAPLPFLNGELVPIIGWLGLLAYIRSDCRTALLDGRVARYCGARSYAVYVLHYPIILLSGWCAWRLFELPAGPAIVVAGLGAAALVLLAAELVYRWVERPAIQFGRRLSAEPVPSAQGW
jgi:peptidoglycan/LPS O-acetylase OafA/YrhL